MGTWFEFVLPSETLHMATDVVSGDAVLDFVRPDPDYIIPAAEQEEFVQCWLAADERDRDCGDSCDASDDDCWDSCLKKHWTKRHDCEVAYFPKMSPREILMTVLRPD